MKKELVELINTTGVFECKFGRNKSNVSVFIVYRGIKFGVMKAFDISEKLDFEPVIQRLADEIINKLGL